MKTKGKFILLEGISGSGKTTLAKALVEYLKERDIDVMLNSEPTKKNSFGRVVRLVIEGNEVSKRLLKEMRGDIAFLSAVGFMNNCGDEQKYRREKIQFCKKLECIWMKLDSGRELTELERQILFITDRFIDLKATIIPSLEEGIWVVQDRYDLSNLAYGSAHGVPLIELNAWHKAVLGDDYLIPDVTFFIHVSPELAVQRLKDSGKPIDLHEGLESLKKIAVQYEAAIGMRKAECLRVAKHANIVSFDGSLPVETTLEDVKNALMFANLLKK